MGKKGIAYSTDLDSTPYRPARLVKGSRWYIEYWLLDTATNELRRIRQGGIKGKTTTQKLDYAQRVINHINGLLAEGYVYNPSYSVPKPKAQVIDYRLGSILQSIVSLKVASGSTRTGGHYSSLGNIFLTWLADNYPNVSASEFTKPMAYQYADWLLRVRKVSNRTHNNYIEGLRGLFSAALKRELVPDNPFTAVELLPIEVGKNIAFTHEEQAILEKWLWENDRRLYYLTRFIYYGFLRPIELCQLRIRDIDLANRRIMLHSNITKNNKQQPVAMNLNLVQVVQEMNLEGVPAEYFVFGKKMEVGRVSQPRNRVSERHRIALEATGIYARNNQVTMYSWRHTGAVRAFEAGANILLLKDMLRHYSLEETNIYLKSLGLTVSSQIQAMKW